MKIKAMNLIRFMFLLGTGLFLLSNSGNPPNGRTGAPGEASCGGCHNGGDYTGTVSISGIPASISPNTTYTVTLTNNTTGTSPVTGGFQIVALDENNNNIGDLQDISADVRTTIGAAGREYAEQDGAKSYGSGSSVSWTFEWTSPATAPQNGDVTFYYVMNMTNGMNNLGGDKVITSSTTVNLPAGSNPLSVTVNELSDVSCFGGSDGAAVAIASGGSGTYFYQWSNNATSSTVNNLSAGTSTVTVTDSNGETATGSVFISQPSPLNATVTSIDVSCNGEDDGFAIVIPSGGTGPYQFLWSDNTTNASNTDLEAGVYTVTITDNNDCELIETFTIQEPSPLDVSINITSEISCFGDSNGALSASVTGGTSPYNYEWSTGAPNSSISGLSAGVYNVTVTDNNNCEFVQGITLSTPSLLSLTLSSTDESAANANDGTATATGFGGTAPYSFNWSNDASGPFVENLPPGTYTVTLTDDNSCTAEGTVNILEFPCALEATSNSSDPTCFGGNDGQITIQTAGAVGQLSYNWSHDTDLDSASATNLSAGTYTIIITDDAGCTDEETITLGQPDIINITPTVTNVSCPGVCDGTIDLDISGGVEPYSIDWSIGATGSNLVELCPGTYAVTVADANGCFEVTTVFVEDADPISAQASITDVSCFESVDGAIDLNPAGGDGSYNFVWSTQDNTEDLNGVAAGTYLVTVTDGNSCILIEEFVVGGPDELIVDATVTNETGNGANDGSIVLEVSGGTIPYSYLWSNDETTSSIDNLAPGQYSATVTDANLCETEISADVLAFDCLLSLESTLSSPSCFGASDGAINIEVINGTPPFVYEWSTGDDSENLEGVTAGTYGLIITDFAGCVASADFVLNEPEALLVEGLLINPTCSLSCDGMITLNISGGTAPYNTSWSNGQTSTDATDLCADNYDVTVADANGCEEILSFTIIDPPSIEAEVFVEDPSCDGSEGDLMWVEVSNNQGEYTTVWSPINITADTINIENLDYSVVITDENGCSLVQNVDIEYIDVLSLDAEITPVSSANANDASIELILSGGIPPYQYLWNTQDETQEINGLSPGTYLVTVTDGNNCSEQLSVLIEEFDCNITADVLIENPVCSGDPTGSIQLVLENFLAPVTYDWTNDETSDLIENLAAGVYTVEVVDANGCAFSDTYELVNSDTNAPELILTNYDAILNEDGLYSLDDADVVSLFTDDCNIAELEYSPKDFDCSNLGENIISLEVCDANNNCFTGSITLNLRDDASPEVNCPEDAFIPNCLDAYFYEVTASDNCDSAPVIELVEGVSPGGDFPFGETTVIYHVTDASGNLSECIFNITKEGNEGILVGFVGFDEEMLPGDTIEITEPIQVVNPLTVTEGLTFAWYSDGELVSSLANASDIDFMNFNNLELEVYYDELCFETYYFDISLNSSSKGIKKQQIVCYPNPAESFVYLRNIDNEVLDVEVYNLEGALLDVSIQIIEEGLTRINVKDLKPNIYFLKLSFSDHIEIKRIVVL